jgi:hypothetical protein
VEIKYNGVVLDVVEQTRHDRRNVYSEDGVDLLYVEYVLGFLCTYAPGGRPVMPSVQHLSDDTKARISPLGLDRTAQVLRDQPRGRNPGDVESVDETPTMEDADTPRHLHKSGPETDAELRDRLMTPRKPFFLYAYHRETGERFVWVRAPRNGFTVDSANGPTPLACDVVAAAGEPHSVTIHFQIRLAVSPCPVGSDRLILSHRWEMSHMADEDHYLSRVVEGRIIFHPGVREVVQFNPELLRAQLLHPIPLGMQRSAPRVTLSSDGLTLRYTIIDTDPKVVFSPGDSGATRIDIVERHALTVPKYGTG